VWWRGWESRSKLGRADWVRMKLVPQFESQVPDPLGDQLLALLSPGRMAATAIGSDLLIFIGECRLKSATMQVQLDHIAGREGVLWQVREEQFLDNARACDPNGTLLLPCGMRGHDHAAGHPLRSHWHLGAIVEAALHLTFGPLLKLVGRQVQPRLNQRMIEQVIVFATGHKREPSHIGEHGPIAILPIEAQQHARSFELIRRQIPADGHKSLAQFFLISPIPAVAETAEPLITVRLSNRCPCPYHFPALASPVPRCTDLIQSAKIWGEAVGLR
jgi:hypothetical protein